MAILLSHGLNDIIKPNIQRGYYLHFITLIVHCLRFHFARKMYLYDRSYYIKIHIMTTVFCPEKPFRQIRFIPKTQVYDVTLDVSVSLNKSKRSIAYRKISIPTTGYFVFFPLSYDIFETEPPTLFCSVHCNQNNGERWGNDEAISISPIALIVRNNVYYRRY